MAHVDRSYHGQLKRRTIGSATSAVSAGCVCITIDASQGDLFTLTTATTGTGATCVTFDIINAYDGQVVNILYDANDNNDDTSPTVTLEGGAVPSSGSAVGSGNVNFIVVYIFLASGGANAGAYATVTS